MSRKGDTVVRATGAVYFGNWVDSFCFPLAKMLLPLIAKWDFITPNLVTFFSFFLYTLGCVFLFLNFPYHLVLAALLIFIAYLGDHLDGQLARFKNLSSIVGDYLDKVVDVLKIYLLTASLALAVYLKTGEVLYIFLGFTACFFFNWRYYIKLQTMFSRMNQDSGYLQKSTQKLEEITRQLDSECECLSKSFWGKLKIFWLKNRTIFLVDEGEFAVFTGIGALFDKLEIVLWVLVASQTLIAFRRVFQRGSQLYSTPAELLKPMRR